MVTTPGGEFELRQWTGAFKKALILENPDPILDEELRRMGIEPHRVPDAPDEAELVRLLEEGQHNLLFKRSRVEVTEPVVRASKNLAGVMLCCIGHDSVDKDACARHGVMVTNDPVSNGRSVAEMVMGEMIVLSRRIFDSVIEMNASIWRKDNRARYELQGKKLGILGMGNIGRQVAQLAVSMGMEVYFYDTALVPREVGLAMGFQLCKNMEELFRVSDYLTVHVSAEDDHGRSNAGLVDYESLKALGDKEGESPRIFINLARGVVVDPEVLKRAIRDGHVSYAITDVFPEEPGKSADQGWVNPYHDEPRVFATPHIGAATREAQPRIARYVARTTQMFSEFGMLRNCVFRPRATIQFEADYASSMLAVVHVDKRGTKKAVDDAIFGAGANNLQSAHIDFPNVGIAYDLSALDRSLTAEQTENIVREASQLTGDPTAIRWVRTIPLSGE